MGCGCNYSGGGYNNAAGSDAKVIKEGTPGVVGSREATFSEGMVVTSTRRGPFGPTVVGYPHQAMPTGGESGGGRTPFNTPGLGWGKTTNPPTGGRTPFNTPGPGWGRTTNPPTGGGSDQAAKPLCYGGNRKYDQYGRACPGFSPADEGWRTTEGMENINRERAGIPGPYRPADFRNASGSAARGRTPFNTPGGWGRTTNPTNTGTRGRTPFNTPGGWGRTSQSGDMRGLPGMTGRKGPGDGYNFGWRSAPTGGGAVGRRGPGDGYNFGWRSAPTTEGMRNINRERRSGQPYVFGWNRPPKAENFAQRLKGKYGKGFSG